MDFYERNVSWRRLVWSMSAIKEEIEIARHEN